MDLERYLREIGWSGVRSWMVAFHGMGYTEERAELQVSEVDGVAVGVIRTRYISMEPGTSNQSWGPDVCIWNFSASDGSRLYESERQHTECLPSVCAVRRIDDQTITVAIIPRQIRSGRREGEMLETIICKARPPRGSGS